MSYKPGAAVASRQSSTGMIGVMKRIRVYEFGGPEVLRLEEAPDPQPAAGQVLVRIKAAGVNPYDTYMRAGAYGAGNPQLPFTPGSDAGGIIEALGADVSGLAVGERVYTAGTVTGAYAELALCNRDAVQPLPEPVSYSEAAALHVPYGTAFRALFQVARATLGQTVLVHGASGGVGLAAVQFARTAGLTIIGTAGSEEGLRLIRAQGVDHAINHRDAEHGREVLRITGGRGVDVILEMLANVNLGKDLPLLANGGRVVVVGSRGTVEINPRDLMSRGASVTGMMLGALSTEERSQVYRAIDAGLRSGALRPIIGLELPLVDAPEAHRRVLQPGARGKIVLIP
jgi:NADPH2:quinone reductase